MTLADDWTAAAVLDAVPCYPVPPAGGSTPIEKLRVARNGHGFIVGLDGVMLILRRSWLAVDYRVTTPAECHMPYGSIGGNRAYLRCGLIPAHFFEQILAHFTAALPNEAAAFVLWNEQSGAFSIEFPEIEQATPSRLVYRTPQPGPDWHVVCDIHSHGAGGAFFSATDDVDDLGSTKIAMVVGRLTHPDGPIMAMRICVAGMFLPMPLSPFAGPGIRRSRVETAFPGAYDEL